MSPAIEVRHFVQSVFHNQENRKACHCLLDPLDLRGGPCTLGPLVNGFTFEPHRLSTVTLIADEPSLHYFLSCCINMMAIAMNRFCSV